MFRDDIHTFLDFNPFVHFQWQCRSGFSVYKVSKKLVFSFCNLWNRNKQLSFNVSNSRA